ncbi:MAG TPA: VOC family protein [Gemmatimonadales bacterium]|nr:VOC family protein [Gemmatimonadales bacterium]
MIRAMHSVAVFVHDIDRAIKFYEEDLGLTLARRGAFGAEFLDEEPHLGVHPAVHADAKALVGRHTGVTFHVPELVELCERLHARGVRFIAEPTQQEFGIMAMIADPDGNIFALWDARTPA